MKLSGLSESELIDAYKKEVRSILELAVPVWHGALTNEQSNQIERVQKCSLAAILGTKYKSYEEALSSCNLKRLTVRRTDMCSKFIAKNMKSESPMLGTIQKSYETRSDRNLVQEFQCRTTSFFDSSLPFLARLHNSNMKNKKLT